MHLSPWAAFLGKGLHLGDELKSPDEEGERALQYICLIPTATTHIRARAHTRTHKHTLSIGQSRCECVCCVFLRGLVKRHMVPNSMCPDLNYCDSVHQFHIACRNANVCVACTVEFAIQLPASYSKQSNVHLLSHSISNIVLFLLFIILLPPPR